MDERRSREELLEEIREQLRRLAIDEARVTAILPAIAEMNIDGHRSQREIQENLDADEDRLRERLLKKIKEFKNAPSSGKDLINRQIENIKKNIRNLQKIRADDTMEIFSAEQMGNYMGRLQERRQELEGRYREIERGIAVRRTFQQRQQDGDLPDEDDPEDETPEERRRRRTGRGFVQPVNSKFLPF